MKIRLDVHFLTTCCDFTPVSESFPTHSFKNCVTVTSTLAHYFAAPSTAGVAHPSCVIWSFDSSSTTPWIQTLRFPLVDDGCIRHILLSLQTLLRASAVVPSSCGFEACREGLSLPHCGIDASAALSYEGLSEGHGMVRTVLFSPANPVVE